ncbi:MFS transporter [Rickettsiales endosymbiont of Paramecium tredecaurelia]|uniref:MFS transporter n=1 Tax=Candidatus Sarmatiella mevalonica TaxID=2770581 RepID=UPI001924C78C|nr:MFS transporter [Candidatus Sarmatiella mevalonica]MBL3285052.1 MFS transporter [Candidatus Sarmatiella mevalonica]
MNITKPQLDKTTLFVIGLINSYEYALFGFSIQFFFTYLNAFKSDCPATSEAKCCDFLMLFALANIARPIGSVFFGWIGDKLGRLKAIYIATALSSLSSLIIAIWPMGNNLTIIGLHLLIARIIFIFSLAGHLDGIRIYTLEQFKVEQGVQSNALVSFFNQVGVLIASCAFHFAQYHHEQMPNAWRINFVLGSVAGLLFLVLLIHRSKWGEVNQYQTKRTSLFKVMEKELLIKIILAILVYGLSGALYTVLIIFWSHFVINYLHTTPTISSEYIVGSYMLTCLLLCIGSSAVYKYKTLIMLFSAGLLLVGIYIQGHAMLFASSGLAVLMVLNYSVIQRLFPERIRFRACSISHSIGSLCFSAISPYIITKVYLYSQQTLNAKFFLFAIVLALVLLYFLIRQSLHPMGPHVAASQKPEGS